MTLLESLDLAMPEGRTTSGFTVVISEFPFLFP